MAMDTTNPIKNGGSSKWGPSYFLIRNFNIFKTDSVVFLQNA